MPPAKRFVNDDVRSDASNVRERQIAAAAHARSKKTAASTLPNGSGLREVALPNTGPAALSLAMTGQATGMAWNAAPSELLDIYRVSHHLAIPAAFTSPLRQALLTNPGIGRQSPTMARKKEKRRISKDQLALAVRKHFNGAAVNEVDVVVELLYKVRNQDKTFRMRSLPGAAKKQV